MFGAETLDVLIGLVTIYLVFGIACTAIVEAFAAWLKVRSKNLEAAMDEFLAGDLNESQKFVAAFYAHPLVQSLSKGKKKRPSYIPPETVGQVVEDLVMKNNGKDDKKGKKSKNAVVPFASLVEAVNALPKNEKEPGEKKNEININRIRGLLQVLVKQAGGDATAFRKAVETHFNAVMERVSGWVKRRQQLTAIIAAACLVAGANVDTIAIATSLAASPEARKAIIEIAKKELEKPPLGAEGKKESKGEAATAAEQKKQGPGEKGKKTGQTVSEQSKQMSGNEGEKSGKKENTTTVEQKAQNPAGEQKQESAAAGGAAVEHAKQESGDARIDIEHAMSVLQSTGLPFGWKDQWSNLWTGDGVAAKVLTKLAGLLFSIFAISLGAPFWFDILQRFMKVRATGFSEKDDKKKK